MPEWSDSDEFWEAVGVFVFDEDTLRLAPQQVERILKLANLEPPLDVLDLPCGVGRHSIELARLGCTVTAADRTSAYLDQARAHAEEANLEVEFIKADMRYFKRPNAFDLALNLFSSFGYFENRADDRTVLANFFQSLRPGGTLVMEMAGKEPMARDFQAHDWQELDDGTLVLQERNVAGDWTSFENRWIIVKPDGQRLELPVTIHIYGAAELKSLLEQAGFNPVHIYGSLDGIPYDHQARRLVAVARKP